MLKFRSVIATVAISLLLAVAASAATITIAATTTATGTTYPGSTCELRIWASQLFTANDGTTVMGGAAGSGAFYKTVPCTVTAGVITISAFTIPSTTDAIDNQLATYTAIFYDSKGVKRDTFFSNFRVPITLGTSITWPNLRLHNAGQQPWRDTNVYTRTQVDLLVSQVAGINTKATTTLEGIGRLSVNPVDAAHPVMMGANDARVNEDFNAANYASLSDAVAAMPGGGATLVVSTSMSAVGVTVPTHVHLRVTGQGQLTGSGTVTIQGDLEAPKNKRIFGSGLTVSFSGNKTMVEIYPEWWGGGVGIAAATNDAANAAAIAALKTGPGGIFKLTAGARDGTVSYTGTTTPSTIIIEGVGPASVLRATGAAPPLKLVNPNGVTVRNLTLTGNSAAPAPSALNLNQQSGIPIHAVSIENVRIGGGADVGDQFTHGILFDGIAANNSEIYISNVDIASGSGDGIHIATTQSINLHITGLNVNGYTNGVWSAGAITGTSWNFNSCINDFNLPATDDLGTPTNPIISVFGYHSENGSRLAVMAAGGGGLSIDNGTFALGTSSPVNGKVVEASGFGPRANFTLVNFVFGQLGSPPTAPFLDFSGAAGHSGSKTIILDGVDMTPLTGATQGMTVLTGDPTDCRVIYYRRMTTAGLNTIPDGVWNYLCGAAGLEWDPSRFQIRGASGFDIFAGDANGSRVFSNGTDLFVQNGGGVTRFRVSGTEWWNMTSAGDLVAVGGGAAIAPLFRSTTAKILLRGTGTGPTQLATTQTTAPTCSSNCGTSPSVVGTDTFMTVTMGATGSPASGFVVTFNGTWAAAPPCVVQSGLSTMVVGKMPIAVQTSTTTITVTTNGTAPGNSDKYQIHCGGTQ